MLPIDQFRDGDPPLEWEPFQILELLGKGGAARVYRAVMRTELGEGIASRVALKVLNPVDDEVAGKAHRDFLHEVGCARNLRHPGVVSTYEGDELDGRLWLSMEYVPGGTLADRVAVGPLERDEVLRIGLELALALHAIHEHTEEGTGRPLGLVHRDVKPANVLMEQDGRARLSDFGIAKATGLTSTATAEGVIKGSAPYLAPEQLDQQRIQDRRTDIWALGAVLYEMATGRRVFRAAAFVQVLAEIAMFDQPGMQGSLDRLAAEADEKIPGLGGVLRGCLRREAGDRFCDALALAKALRRLDERRHLDFEADHERPWARFRLLSRLRLDADLGLWRTRDEDGRELALAVFRLPVDRDALAAVAALGPRPGLVALVVHGEDFGLSWAAWEPVCGEPLERRLRGGLGAGDVARWARGLASALAVLHGTGIAHGQVGRRAVVLDGDDRARLAWPGLEAALGRGDPGSDLGALGRLLEELAAGARRRLKGEPRDNALAGLSDLALRCRPGAPRGLADAAALSAALAELLDRGRLDFESESYPRRWGEFELRGRLGAGAFGTVWDADWHRGLGVPKRVALKVLRPSELERAEDRRSLFLREAKVALAVRHPALVETYRAGEDFGLLWLAMERVQGRSLRDVLEEQCRLEPEDVLRTGRGICAGLQALHEARRPGDEALLGCVHRDLKPANVMLEEGGRVLLMDFGITKACAEEVQLTVAGSGTTRGTLHFMSPEQWQAGELDPRSDLYALGVLLLEAATGWLLFREERKIQPLFERVRGIEALLPEIVARADEALPGLGAVVSGCLRWEREHRWGSAAEVAALLAGLEGRLAAERAEALPIPEAEPRDEDSWDTVHVPPELLPDASLERDGPTPKVPIRLLPRERVTEQVPPELLPSGKEAGGTVQEAPELLPGPGGHRGRGWPGAAAVVGGAGAARTGGGGGGARGGRGLRAVRGAGAAETAGAAGGAAGRARAAGGGGAAVVVAARAGAGAASAGGAGSRRRGGRGGSLGQADRAARGRGGHKPRARPDTQDNAGPYAHAFPDAGADSRPDCSGHAGSHPGPRPHPLGHTGSHAGPLG